MKIAAKVSEQTTSCLDSIMDKEMFNKGREDIAYEAGKICALREVGLSGEEALNFVLALKTLNSDEVKSDLTI